MKAIAQRNRFLSCDAIVSASAELSKPELEVILRSSVFAQLVAEAQISKFKDYTRWFAAFESKLSILGWSSFPVRNSSAPVEMGACFTVIELLKKTLPRVVVDAQTVDWFIADLQAAKDSSMKLKEFEWFRQYAMDKPMAPVTAVVPPSSKLPVVNPLSANASKNVECSITTVCLQIWNVHSATVVERVSVHFRVNEPVSDDLLGQTYSSASLLGNVEMDYGVMNLDLDIYDEEKHRVIKKMGDQWQRRILAL